MPKIRFNPQAIGRIAHNHSGDMRDAARFGAFIPVVVIKPGIEAVEEGFRLANIECFHPTDDMSAEDVDTGDI